MTTDGTKLDNSLQLAFPENPPEKVDLRSMFVASETRQIYISQLRILDLSRDHPFTEIRLSDESQKLSWNASKFSTKWAQEICIPVLQWQNAHTIDPNAKVHENAFAFVVFGGALLEPKVPKY